MRAARDERTEPSGGTATGGQPVTRAARTPGRTGRFRRPACPWYATRYAHAPIRPHVAPDTGTSAPMHPRAPGRPRAGPDARLSPRQARLARAGLPPGRKLHGSMNLTVTALSLRLPTRCATAATRASR